MVDPIPTVLDLATFLGLANIDEGRADLVITAAVNLCQSVVNPLPAGASAVVLDVATRAYMNPTNATQETTGPFGVNYGTVSGGLWLTQQNKLTLRRLNGGGGAFTIDTTPAGAGTGLPWWEQGGWLPQTATDFDTPTLSP
jgi:hypothetical protein